MREETDKAKPENDREEKVKEKGGGSGGGGDIGDLHLFGQDLLKTLPKPETDWSVTAHIKWLQTAANILDLIYTRDVGGIAATSAGADRSPRPREQ